MKDWKTTVAGTLAALPSLSITISAIVGIQPWPPEVLAAINTVGVFLLGLFAKQTEKDNAI